MNLEDLKKIRERREQDMFLRDGKARLKVVVGMGTSGIAAGARQTMRTFLDEIEKRGLKDVLVTQTGERGLSSKEPIVTVLEEGKSGGRLWGGESRCGPQDRYRALGQRESRFGISSGNSKTSDK